MESESSMEPFSKEYPNCASIESLKIKYCCRDVAQFGSAPCSGRGGRKFESCHPDLFKKKFFIFYKISTVKGIFETSNS